MLNRQVLVLNKYWVAVHVCTVRRALTLVFEEMARIVCDDFQTYDFESWRELSAYAAGADPVVHTPNFQLLLPRVIVLAKYQNYPPRSVKFNRRNIFIRDNHTCQYCGRRAPKDDMTIDHIIPKSRGGRTVWENIVLACTHCNTKKGSKLPAECHMHPRTPPRKPNWFETLYTMPSEGDLSLWQKFVDIAYWETKLHHD